MVKRVPALISKQLRHGTERSPMLLGVDLMDAKEEVFVRMVTDGIAMGVAFARAGFKSKHGEAPYKLWSLPRIQERAAAILEARRTTGVVTLPQVTSMLQRVFSSAYHADEFNAAHNAALSLARLYGHVNDRQTLEVIRRPSRDPDAPSEQDLSTWVESLPAINAPDGAGFSHSVLDQESAIGPLSRAPAPLLADGVERVSDPVASNPIACDTPVDWLASPMLPTSAAQRSMSSDINDLPNDMGLLSVNSNDRASDSIACDPIVGEGIGPGGRSENGAPARPVTGTPNSGAHFAALKLGVVGTTPTRGEKKKRVPRQKKQVPVPKREKIPSAEDLF